MEGKTNYFKELVFKLLLMSAILCANLAEPAQIQLTKMSKLAENAGIDPIFTGHRTFALNTRTGETLVVWNQALQEQPSAVFARIINAKGIPITKNIHLAGRGGTSTVAYNPITDEYLLAYDEAKGVSILRLNPKGRPIGKPVQVSTNRVGSDLNFAPAVLFNPKTNGYVLFWLVHLDQGIDRTGFQVGVLLNTDGKPTGSPREIASFRVEPGKFYGILAFVSHWVYLPSAGKLLGIYREFDRDGPPFKINDWLAVVDPELKTMNKYMIHENSIVTESRLAYDNYAMDLALVSDDSAVVFFLDADGKVKGRSIGSNGKFDGESFPAFQDPLTNTSLFGLHAAFTQTSFGPYGILLGTKRDSSSVTLWAQLLRKKGKPSGVPLELFAVSDNSQYVLGNVVALPSSSGDTVFRFTALETTLFIAPVYARDNRSSLYQLLLNLKL